MAELIRSRSADEAWQAAGSLLNSKKTLRQASRVGETVEALQVAIEISDPRLRWVVSRSPAINPAFALVEVLWILQGRNDAHLPTYFNSRLPDFSGNTPTFHGAYGNRLRESVGIDQLKRAADALRGNPDSRQVVLQVWDSKLDFPNTDGSPRSDDIPCNVLSMLKIRDGRLHWTQILRSNDIHRGFPHNVVQWTVLQEIMAGWIGVELGTYTHFADSLHAYTTDLDYYEQIEPISLDQTDDSLSLPPDQYDDTFPELASRVDRIASAAASTSDIISLTEWDGPTAYKNILLVIAAEGVRRRKDAVAADALIAECSNLAYVQLWTRWIARLSGGSKERST